MPAKFSDSCYLPQLDSLRGLAVLAIMWHHWAPERLKLGIPWSSAVQFFFVLSGFLITRILLVTKETIDQGRTSNSRALKFFYARRALRLFPIFYLVLAIATFSRIGGLPKGWIWHATYMSNIYFLYQPGWGTPIGHFWTLAVEEQFYFLWPWLVLSLSRFKLRLVIVLMILVAVCYRAFGRAMFPAEHYSIFTLGCLDSLGCGCALATVPFACTEGTPQRFLLWPSIGIAFTSLVVGMLYILSATPSCIDLTLQSVLFTYIIFKCANGLAGPFGSMLSSYPLRSLGTISYGMYLLHNFASIPTAFLIQHLPAVKSIPGNIILINFLITMSCAIILWYAVEKPLLSLRRSLR